MNAKNKFTIALCRPQLPENIGASARACSVMGLTQLALVAPQCSPLDAKAFQLASHAAPLLEQAKHYNSLSELINGNNLLVGFSARSRALHVEQCSLPELSHKLQVSTREHVVLVFGAERTGLTNEELSFCHLQCFIPTFNPDYGSLNLAQAVQLVTYTVALSSAETEGLERPEPVAEKNTKLTQAFYKYLDSLVNQELMHDFCQRTTLERTLLRLRLLFNKVLERDEDAEFLFGFLKALTKR